MHPAVCLSCDALDDVARWVFVAGLGGLAWSRGWHPLPSLRLLNLSQLCLMLREKERWEWKSQAPTRSRPTTELSAARRRQRPRSSVTLRLPGRPRPPAPCRRLGAPPSGCRPARAAPEAPSSAAAPAPRPRARPARRRPALRLLAGGCHARCHDNLPLGHPAKNDHSTEVAT